MGILAFCLCLQPEPDQAAHGLVQARIMRGLHTGKTLRHCSVNANNPRFLAYCEAHPDYAQEARPLIEANVMAARCRKGSATSRDDPIFLFEGSASDDRRQREDRPITTREAGLPRVSEGGSS
jgi:hypothetical protein